jgi:hypothetical protein
VAILGGVGVTSAPERSLDLNKAANCGYNETETIELCATLDAVLATIGVLVAPVERISL